MIVSRTTPVSVGRGTLDVRHDEETAARLPALSGPVEQFDRDVESNEVDTMDWGTDATVRNCEGTPAAVVDNGAVGKEPMRRLVASDVTTVLADARVLSGAAEEN